MSTGRPGVLAVSSWIGAVSTIFPPQATTVETQAKSDDHERIEPPMA